MKKILPIAIAAFFGLAGMAHAATLVVLDGGVTYDLGGAVLSPDVNIGALSPTQLQLTGDASVISPALPNSPNQYTAPDGGAVFGGNYLAVIATPSPAGTAVYNLSSGQSVFGFTWGSVDSFNTLVLHTTNGDYTITGTDIKNNIPGVSLGTTDEDVVFSDSLGAILSATFTSTQNSFEVANLEAVPLPAALTLFGTALLGLGAFSVARRKAV